MALFCLLLLFRYVWRILGNRNLPIAGNIAVILLKLHHSCVYVSVNRRNWKWIYSCLVISYLVILLKFKNYVVIELQDYKDICDWVLDIQISNTNPFTYPLPSTNNPSFSPSPQAALVVGIIVLVFCSLVSPLSISTLGAKLPTKYLIVP